MNPITHNQRQVMEATGRHKTILRLRAQGKTFGEIGVALGISSTRAGQLYRRAVEIQKDAERPITLIVSPGTPIEMLAISQRTRNALRNAGHERVEDILPFDKNMIRELLGLSNLGRISVNEVHDLLVQHDLVVPDAMD